MFGFITLSILLIPMYYIPVGAFSGNERGVMEDAIDAFVQLGNNGLLLLAFLCRLMTGERFSSVFIKTLSRQK